MTLIIGIKCEDGIVLGADGAATLSTLNQPTVLQPIKKLACIDEKVIVGVSGPVGLAQRFTTEIEALWQGKEFSNKSPNEAKLLIQAKVRPHLISELNMAQIARPVIGNAALNSAISDLLVALPVSKKPCLFHFDQQGAPEEANDDLPFVSIGSGQQIADPFLAFLRRIFWKDKIPNLWDGIFAALWTLDHAIKIAPGGVAEPKQLVVLSKINGDWQTRILSNSELQEYYQAINAAEGNLLRFREELSQDSGKQAEPPPEPQKK